MFEDLGKRLRGEKVIPEPPAESPCLYAKPGRKDKTPCGKCAQRWRCTYPDLHAEAEIEFPTKHCLSGCKYRAERRPLNILLLAPPNDHVGLFAQIRTMLERAGCSVGLNNWTPTVPKWGLTELVAAQDIKPDIIMRWEEHGGLYVDREWREACNWCYDQGIMPAMIDWGFFAHYRSVYAGYYLKDGRPDVTDVWPILSTIIDWTRADPVSLEWRAKWLLEWERSKELGPLPGTEPGYVLFWVQYSGHGSRIKGWTGANWCEKAAAQIRAAGLVPVFKLPPKPGKMPIPEGEITFAHRAKHECLNARLIRYAAHSIAITTTATAACVLSGTPVVSCGDQWCEGLGVWHDTRDAADFCKTPEVNQEARAKWVNYWLRRQFDRQDAPTAFGKLYAEWRAKCASASKPVPNVKATRAIYLTGRGLGNLMMAIPAIKGLAARTGLPIEVASAKAITLGFLELLKGLPYIKSATRSLPAASDGIIAGAAALNYPPEIAKAQYGSSGHVSAAPSRLYTVHESEQDAVVARELGLSGPLPNGRIQTVPPPADLPPQYVAVGMECAERWAQGRKRLWPHWQKFAQLWRSKSEIPLVFLGTQPEAWTAGAGIDMVGKTPNLRTTASIIGAADAFVGIDGGLSHVAGAVGTPALVLYGPTTSYHTGPYYGGLTSLDGKYSCRACFGGGEWDKCKHPRCMASIAPEKVVDALERLLWRRGRPLEPETAREQSRGRWYHAVRTNRRPAQWPQELEALWPMLSEKQAATVLEIGVRRGGWLYVMAPCFRPGAHIIGIEQDLRYLSRNGWEAGLRSEGYRVDLIMADSHSPQTFAIVREKLGEKRLDILHIDGDHSVESALGDWQTYRPLVRSGGLVVMHDAFNAKEGVPKALEIIRQEEGSKVRRWQWISCWLLTACGPGIAIAEIA